MSNVPPSTPQPRPKPSSAVARSIADQQGEPWRPGMPPGMAAGPLFDPMAIMQEFLASMRENQVLAEQTARYLADASNHAAAAARISSDMHSTRAAVTRGDAMRAPLPEPPSSRAPEARRRAVHTPSGVAPPEHVRPPFAVSPASMGDEERLQGAPSSPLSLPGMVEERFRSKGGDRYNLAEIRQDASRWVAQRLSGVEIGPQLAQDDSGKFYTAASMQPNEAGKVVPQEASQSAIRKFQRWQSVAGAVKNVASGEEVGSALRAAIPGGAAKALGAAGIAYTVADQVRGFAEGQREANLEWQRTMGGGNAAGFEERARSQLFELGQSWFGGMGAGRAQALYQGAAEIAGPGRRDVQGRIMDFGAEMYRKLGVDIKESLDLVSTASDAGIEHFDSLADALENVTKAAREAGINTQKMREQFTENFRAVTSMVGSETTAPALAAAMTNAVSAMGPGFEDVRVGGMLTNEMQMRRLSRQMGYANVGQMMAAAGTNEGAVAVTRAADTMARQDAGRALRPAGQQIISQFVQQHGGNLKVIRPDDWRRVGEQIMQTGQFDPFMAMRIASQMTGTQIEDPAEAAAVLAQQWAGATSLERGTKDAIRQSQSRKVDIRSDNAFTPTKSAMALGEELGLKDTEARNIVTDAQTGHADRRRTGGGSGTSKQAYLQGVLKTGQRDPIVERMLTNMDKDWKIQVRTNHGDRVVSGEEAVRHFRDQIQSGDARIVEGEGEGSTIADYFKMTPDKDTKVTSVGKHSAKRGESVKEFEKGREKGGGGGKVTIEPSPELRRWLRFNVSGNVDAAGYQGVPPDAFLPPSNMPSGNG